MTVENKNKDGLDSNVVSLSELRREHNQSVRKGYLEPEDRIRELEEEVSRLIEALVEVEHRVYRSEGRLSRQWSYLIRLVRLIRGKDVK